MTQVILHFNIQNGSNPIESSNFWIVIHTSLPFKLCWFCTSNVKYCFTYLFILTNMIQYANETQTMFWVNSCWLSYPIYYSEYLHTECHLQYSVTPACWDIYPICTLQAHLETPSHTLCHHILYFERPHPYPILVC